jgi:hypothetical protein
LTKLSLCPHLEKLDRSTEKEFSSRRTSTSSKIYRPEQKLDHKQQRGEVEKYN